MVMHHESAYGTYYFWVWLNPLIGIFHKNEYNQFNLVDDLMEPFRQIVDVWVYQNLRDEEYLKYGVSLGANRYIKCKDSLR